MRAAIVEGPGQTPTFGTFEEAQAGPGGEILDLVGAGLHQVVRARSQGRHYSSEGIYPLVPGVDAIGRRTDGRLVYAALPPTPWGTMAERFTARLEVELPEGIDPLAAAAAVNPGLSGWLPLTSRLAEIGSLGTVLVVGATGMAGRLAVQSALHLGATRVVAVGRNRVSLDSLSGEGVATVPLGAPDDAGAIAEALGATSPSVVLDYVWGPVAESVFAALGRGRPAAEAPEVVFASIGSMAGRLANVPSELLRSRRIRIVGSGLGSVPVGAVGEQVARFLVAVRDARIEVPYVTFALEHVADAWAYHGQARPVIVP